MPARSLVMHLLLSFTMILNGSVAAAGVMPEMAAAGVASATASAIVGAGHCDGMVMMQPAADSNTVSPQQSSASQHAADSSGHTSPDCCKSGLCQCACVQATATSRLLLPALLTISISVLAEFVDSGVAATHAPRLDRPPIG